MKLFLCIGFFILFPVVTFADVRINEVFPNPSGSDDGAEFVELFNDGDDVIDLSGWHLEDGSGRSDYTFSDESAIGPEDYLVLYKKTDFSFSLNNDEDSLTLKNSDGEVVFSVDYESAREDQSWNFDGEQWHWSEEITPNEQNPAREEVPEIEILDQYPPLILSELLPNPEGDETKEEFIEIYNPTDSAVPLWGWMLADSGRGDGFVFEQDTIIAAKEYVTISRAVFDFALNNSGSETVTLTTPNGQVLDTVRFSGAQEGAVLAWTGARWRWTPYATPDAPNAFPEEIEIDLDVPKKVFVHEQATFSAKIATHDDVSVRWDFGDGSRSYKEVATHAFTKTGTFDAALTVTTPLEKIVKEFSVRIRKYPEHKITITAFLPNPVGADTGNEWVELTNNEQKEIDVKQWQLLSGAHPERLTKKIFTKSFVLAPGGTRRVTQEDLSFVLTNTTGVVRLARPDSSIASEAVYEIPKGQKEGAVFSYASNTWQWSAKENDDIPDSIAQKEKIIAQARANTRTRGAVLGEQATNLFSQTEIVRKKQWYDPVLDFFLHMKRRTSLEDLLSRFL